MKVLGFFIAATFANVLYAGADERLAVQKLRTYCRACHGVGELRFLRSDDDDEVWASLYRDIAPNSKKTWARAIREVLSWPSDEPPPFDKLLQAPDRDWMPKGAKRASFASDRVGAMATRRFILETLGD